MSSDFVLIQRTNTIEEADIIVAWLEEQGIEATIVDRANAGAMLFGVTDSEGFAICAEDAATADRAVKLLEEHQPVTKKVVPPGTKVKARCEDCGKDSIYPGEQAGSVQECNECGAYLDVPEL